jgi:hypothetical protein
MSNRSLLLIAGAIVAGLTACSQSSSTMPYAASVPAGRTLAPNAAPTIPPLLGPVDFITDADLKNPTQLRAIRSAFDAGTLIALTAQPQETLFTKKLGIAIPTDSAPPAGRNASRSIKLLAIGAHLRSDGTVSTFELDGNVGTDVEINVANMVNREFTKALVDNQPELGAWTPIGDNDARVSSLGGFADFRYGVYRLNSGNADYDWYMLTGALETRADPGWIVTERSNTINLVPQGEVYNHGPTTANKVTTYSWTVGAELSGILGAKKGDIFGGGGLKFNASWTKQWNTEAVTTIDRTGLYVAAWRDLFAAAQEAARSNYINYDAVIFQVPKGRSPINYQLNIGAQYAQGKGTTGGSRRFDMAVMPPTFDVKPAVVTIPQGKPAYVLVRSEVLNPQGQLIKRLKFAINRAGRPNWLVVPDGGTQTCMLKLEAQTGTPVGSRTYIEFDTSPPFAAQSLEMGPQSIFITVGPPDASPPPIPSPAPPPCVL